MERLTITKNENGFVGCKYEDADCNDSCMYGECKWRQKAIARLADYEDTGLMPEDILSALELANIWAALRQLEKYEKLQPINEWHEDMGDCLFWKLPVQESPYCGTPLDGDWDEGYYTHFTRLPIPKENN